MLKICFALWTIPVELPIIPSPLALNMFCQYTYLWMYVIPAADLLYIPS